MHEGASEATDLAKRSHPTLRVDGREAAKHIPEVMRNVILYIFLLQYHRLFAKLFYPYHHYFQSFYLQYNSSMVT